MSTIKRAPEDDSSQTRHSFSCSPLLRAVQPARRTVVRASARFSDPGAVSDIATPTHHDKPLQLPGTGAHLERCGQCIAGSLPVRLPIWKATLAGRIRVAIHGSRDGSSRCFDLFGGRLVVVCHEMTIPEKAAAVWRRRGFQYVWVEQYMPAKASLARCDEWGVKTAVKVPAIRRGAGARCHGWRRPPSWDSGSAAAYATSEEGLVSALASTREVSRAP